MVLGGTAGVVLLEVAEVGVVVGEAEEVLFSEGLVAGGRGERLRWMAAMGLAGC